MSEYLLLRDIRQCPRCRAYTAPKSLPSLCRNCGVHLFKFSDALREWESETGWREYWVWTGIELGWKHRDFIWNTDEKPLTREYKQTKLPNNYGTEEYQKQRVEESRKELKEVLKKKKLKKVLRKIYPERMGGEPQRRDSHHAPCEF